MNRDELLSALNACGWRAKAAAEMLHFSPHTVNLYTRIYRLYALRPCSVCGRQWERTNMRRVCSDGCRVQANRKRASAYKRRRAAAQVRW